MGVAYRPQPYRTEPDETIRCPKDGRMNDSDAHFCDQDGTKLEGRADIAGSEGKPYVPKPYKPDPDETIVCPTDKRKNDDDAHFCDQDGTKLEGRRDVTGSFVMLSKACPAARPWAVVDVQSNALQNCYASEEAADAAA